MGFLDGIVGALKGAMGQAGTGDVPTLISAVLAKTGMGDLQGLATKLQQGGLQDQVQSWLGPGRNLPVTADQLRAALGSAQVRQLAEHLGLPADAALELLSKNLPTLVDQASPSGAIER